MSRAINLNRSALLGQFYDWPYGGYNPTGQDSYPKFNARGEVPIDQDNKRVNGKYPPGGDWIAWRRDSTNVCSKSGVHFRPGFGRAYEGSFYLRDVSNIPVPDPDVIFADNVLADIVSTLEGYGAEGFAKARPAQPDFSLATSFLELKDVPGMLKQGIHLFINRVLTARPDLYYSFGRNAFFRVKNKTRLSHTAEWYLALNFGWLPIIRDITNFMEASAKSDASMKQLLRDEGRPVIRRRILKQSESRGFVRAPDFYQTIPTYVRNPDPGLRPILVTQCYTDLYTPRKRSYTFSSKVTFVAKFRYWLPSGIRDFPWDRRLRRRMLGSRITPSVAWNLMPWTFISDYFTSLGDAIGNLGPGVEDQLLTEYCYILYEENYVFEDESIVQTFADLGGTTPQNGKATRLETLRLKMRVSADPFAFRFFGGEPTLKQKAILAALAVK